MKVFFTLLVVLSFLQLSYSQINKQDATRKKALPIQNKVLDVTSSQIDDSVFVRLEDYSKNFSYEMRYATENNFLKSKVYDCAACYLRLKTVKALINANDSFLKLGYKIKLYDCYRPLDVQKKMWKIVSNPDYVADPKKGSIHNRGGAVDLTLVKFSGKTIDMGTDFDFFGIEASHNFKDFSHEILENRKLLKEVMLANNFKIFDSEWWHYNLDDANHFSISNFKWDCK